MMTFTKHSTVIPIKTLLEKFSDEISLVSKGEATNLCGLAHPSNAQAFDLITLSDEEHVKMAKNSKSLIWLASSKMVNTIQAQPEVTLLKSDNPKLLMAKIAKTYFRSVEHFIPVGTDRVSKTAMIDSSAHLESDVIVGPGAVIGKGCKIGHGVVIGSLAVLEDHCTIEEGSHIHPQVFLGHNTTVGKYSEIKPHAVIGGEGFGYATDTKTGEHHRITHFGKVIIGDFVHIGSGTHIDRGTFEDSRIHNHVKIDNLCHFGHNIEIGMGTIVTGGVVTAGSVTIGKYCVIGGRTTISGHLEIADKVQIGGLSGVTKSISEAGAYGGYPLQPLKDYLKTQSSFPKLPELRKSVAKILKTLNLKESE